MWRILLLLALSSIAVAHETPHFVKSVRFSDDGKKIAQPQVIERSVAWLIKRAPQYWVRIESFNCDADIETKEDSVEKLAQKAQFRGEQIKTELVARTILAEKIEVVSLGKSEKPSICSVRILAGPKLSDASTPAEEAKKK